MTRRFLVLFPQTSYYKELAGGIARAFGRAGIESREAFYPSTRPLHASVKHSSALAIEQFSPTDVLTINDGREDLGIPAGIRLHVWIQDAYDSMISRGGTCDRLWNWIAYWDRWHGGDFLPPSTDYHLAEDPPEDGYDYDIAFAGYYPAPEAFDFSRFFGGGGASIAQDVAREWLSSPHVCGRAFFERLVSEIHHRLRTGPERPNHEQVIHRLWAHFQRRFQRERMALSLLAIAKRHGFTVALGGYGWNKDPRFAPWAVGYVHPGAPFRRFVRRARVNLHVDGATNLHQRVIECLASGAFVAAEEHPYDQLDGSLRWHFSDTQVPTWRDADGLERLLVRYVRDDPERDRVKESSLRLARERFSHDGTVRRILGGQG